MNVNTSNLEKNIEQWASIDGYLNYQVSWFGRVVNTTTGRLLKGSMTNGYLRVGLCKNGKHKLLSVHSLVAREWVSNPENKQCVDHIDGDRTNNNYENLRYATSAEISMNRKKATIGQVFTRALAYIKQRINGKHSYGSTARTKTWEVMPPSERRRKPTMQPRSCTTKNSPSSTNSTISLVIHIFVDYKSN